MPSASCSSPGPGRLPVNMFLPMVDMKQGLDGLPAGRVGSVKLTSHNQVHDERKFTHRLSATQTFAKCCEIVGKPSKVIGTRCCWDHSGQLTFDISTVVFRYYFPTYENDALLCTLSDSESDLAAQEQNENVPIIGEDTSKLHALKQSSVLNQLLLQDCLES